MLACACLVWILACLCIVRHSSVDEFTCVWSQTHTYACTHARISYTYSTSTIVKWLLLLSLSISPFSVPFLRRLPSLLPAPSFSTPCVEHSFILPFPSPSPPLSRPPTPPPLPHLACSACRALHVVAVVVVLIFFSFFFCVCLSPVPKPLLAHFEALPVTACAPLRRCLSCPSPVSNSSVPSSLPSPVLVAGVSRFPATPHHHHHRVHPCSGLLLLLRCMYVCMRV